MVTAQTADDGLVASPRQEGVVSIHQFGAQRDTTVHRSHRDSVVQLISSRHDLNSTRQDHILVRVCQGSLNSRVSILDRVANIPEAGFGKCRGLRDRQGASHGQRNGCRVIGCDALRKVVNEARLDGERTFTAKDLSNAEFVLRVAVRRVAHCKAGVLIRPIQQSSVWQF